MNSPSPFVVVYFTLKYGPATLSSPVPIVEDIPIASFGDHEVSFAREGVLSPIVAVIFTALDEVTGLSSLLSHAANAREAATRINIFSFVDI